MKTSIATVCLSGGLSEKLQSIATAGFHGVEIFESDLLSYNGSPADIAKEMSDLGLRAITFQPFRDFEGMPEPQRQRTFDRAERKFDLMQELGCDSLLVCSNVSPESVGGIDRSAAVFMNWVSARPNAGCASVSRRWPGDAISTTTVMPGKWCAAQIIRRSDSCSTRSIRSPARPISPRCAPFPATGFFLSSLPMRHGWRWMS